MIDKGLFCIILFSCLYIYSSQKEEGLEVFLQAPRCSSVTQIFSEQTVFHKKDFQDFIKAEKKRTKDYAKKCNRRVFTVVYRQQEAQGFFDKSCFSSQGSTTHRTIQDVKDMQAIKIEVLQVYLTRCCTLQKSDWDVLCTEHKDYYINLAIAYFEKMRRYCER